MLLAGAGPGNRRADNGRTPVGKRKQPPHRAGRLQPVLVSVRGPGPAEAAGACGPGFYRSTAATPGVAEAAVNSGTEMVFCAGVGACTCTV